MLLGRAYVIGGRRQTASTLSQRGRICHLRGGETHFYFLHEMPSKKLNTIYDFFRKKLPQNGVKPQKIGRKKRNKPKKKKKVFSLNMGGQTLFWQAKIGRQ